MVSILPYHAVLRSACCVIHAYIAMPAAPATLMLRVEPNCAIDTVRAAPAFAASVIPGPSWPKISRQSRGSDVGWSRSAPGTERLEQTSQTGIGGEGQQF